jgi:hypothetical protein
MTSQDLNYNEKTISICQIFISEISKYNLSSRASAYKRLIYGETPGFPVKVSFSKRIHAIANNKKCDCVVCGKIHGLFDKQYCSSECYAEKNKIDAIKRHEEKRIAKISKSIEECQGVEYVDFVECKICGYRSKKSISGHLVKHSISDDNYKKQFQLKRVSVHNFGFQPNELNPAYQHGGKLSPWSDKFINPNNIDIEECKHKAQSTIKENGNGNTNIQRWLNLGYSEEEAKIKLSERQTTFSKEKCVAKYGEEKGLEVWKSRQEKWQESLKNKSPEELERINSSKSSKVNYRSLWKHELEDDGLFYVLKLPNHMIKIGITTRGSIKNRYKKEELQGCEVLFIKESSINECFMLEQLLIKEFKPNRISKSEQFKSFGYTETFDIHSHIIIESIHKKENIEKEFNATFR